MLLEMAPLVVLYEISIVLAKVFGTPGAKVNEPMVPEAWPVPQRRRGGRPLLTPFGLHSVLPVSKLNEGADLLQPIRPAAKKSRRRSSNIAALALAAVLAVSALAAPIALARGSKTAVGEAQAPSLHEKVLTSSKGLTLYSLSIEKKGKFVCTAGCTYTWKPLVVPAGTTPKGPVTLGTIKRPEGKTQVTFKGLPLYTFDGDHAKGQANGEGVDDVGTWHAVTL